MFDNIEIVFYIYKGKMSDCRNYAVFDNIKDNIDTIKGAPENIKTINPSPEILNVSTEVIALSKGGTIRKSMKRNKKRKTILRKSKRFNKKRNKRRTNKKKRLTKKINSRRTHKKRFTKRR